MAVTTCDAPYYQSCLAPTTTQRPRQYTACLLNNTLNAHHNQYNTLAGKLVTVYHLILVAAAVRHTRQQHSAMQAAATPVRDGANAHHQSSTLLRLVEAWATTHMGTFLHRSLAATGSKLAVSTLTAELHTAWTTAHLAPREWRKLCQTPPRVSKHTQSASH
jgi:hypothetical protein